MTQVQPGMSKYDVVDLLGPPLDFMNLGELHPQLSHTVNWLYLDVPPGRETTVSFVQDVVTSAQDRTYDDTGRQRPENEWTQRVLPKHFAKVESNPAFDDLVRQPGWQRLRSPEVSEWVQNTHAAAKSPNQLGRAARRFGELDVIVSYCALTSAAELRSTYFPNGYLPVLSDFIIDFGIRPKQQRDVAHWILGRRSADDTIAHLAFVPLVEVMMLLPWDLLSAGEQAGGSAGS